MICEKCGKEMKTDWTMVLCSNPPQRRWECDCGHIQTQVTGSFIPPQGLGVVQFK